MARLGTKTITGTSGKEYSFNVYKKGMRFNDFIPGVYYIYCEGDDSETAVFLGESGNVDVTLQSHDQATCFNDNNFNRIAFHMNASQSVRDGVVQDLAGELKPCCN